MIDINEIKADVNVGTNVDVDVDISTGTDTKLGIESNIDLSVIDTSIKLIGLVGEDCSKCNILWKLYLQNLNEPVKFYSDKDFLSIKPSFFASDYAIKMAGSTIYFEYPEQRVHISELWSIVYRIIELSKQNVKFVFITNSDIIIQIINNMIKLQNNPDKISLMKDWNIKEDYLLALNDIALYEIKNNNIIQLKAGPYGYVVPSLNKYLDKLMSEIYAFQPDDDDD